jgi:hypothetical protein
MKKCIRTLKQAYAYKKTKQTSVSTVELDEFITTKEDYKAVLSLLINVLENEHNLEIHDIKCNDKTVSFKISEGDGFYNEFSDNEYSCNKNDMFEPRVEIKEEKTGISVEFDSDDDTFE